MKRENFEDRYIPTFNSEELLQAAIFTEAFANYSICSACRCTGIDCRECILNDRDICIDYLKQHPRCLEYWLKYLGKTSKEEEKEQGEEITENDFPKIKPGMAITFTNNNKLGFMVSKTQIMYVEYNYGVTSAIISDWDSLGTGKYDVPYNTVESVYASADKDDETGELIESLIPNRLHSILDALLSGKDPAELGGVRLVWRRPERRKMTVEDIENALGYKIELIEEEEK